MTTASQAKGAEERSFKEKPLMLGEHETMLGILSEPQDLDPKRPTFLLLNAGIVHRVGPHRKTVKLARALAEAGFRTLRFDLSGIGDSTQRRDALDFGASALADIREVCNDLEKKHGIDRFVSMGLCSGADNTFQALLRDERLVGGVLMDGYAYQTPQFYAHHYLKRVKDPERWWRLAKRVVAKGRRRIQSVVEMEAASPPSSEPPSAPAPVPDYIREFPPQEEVTRQLQGLIDRGVRMYWLYTGGVHVYYNYERQFFDCFADVDFKGQLRHDYFAQSNHTFTALETQRALTDAIVDWASAAFPRS